MISSVDAYPFFSIIILIFIVSVNYIGPIFPCKIQDLFSDNIYIKHILGFFTMLFFIIITIPTQNLSIEASFKQSAILYFWFMLMTKTPKYIFLCLCIILLLVYVLTLKKNYILDNNNNKVTNTNNKVTNTVTNTNNTVTNTVNDKAIVETNNKIVIRINNYISHLYDLFIIITIIGCLLYLYMKKKEYKKGFNMFIFILGKPNCS